MFCRHCLSFFPFFFVLPLQSFMIALLFYVESGVKHHNPPFISSKFSCKMKTFSLGTRFAFRKHKIQINNKNVYLLFTITHIRGFYFIKGNPYKNYTDKNHFVSKRIQNRKKNVFKNLICIHLYTLFKFYFPERTLRH